mgnify:CR=1 FL=1
MPPIPAPVSRLSAPASTAPIAPPVSKRRLSRALDRVLDSALTRALAHPHAPDDYLEALSPMWTRRRIHAQVLARRNQTPGTLTLELRPNAAWPGFCAGQHLQIALDVNGVRQQRCFSPANAASERDRIELTLRLGAEGGFTDTLSREAQVGRILALEPAQGEFVLGATPPEHLLLIAGGSGITPLLSMLRTLLAQGHRGRIDLLQYAPQARERLYARELDALAAQHSNLSLYPVYTRGSGGAARGHLDAAQLQGLVPEAYAAQTYVCGPAALQQQAQALWQAAGAQERLAVEAFSAPAPARSDEAGQLRLARSALDLPSDGRPILEQAESAGLQPAHGCRMGICASCRCRKLDGQVRDLQTGRLSGAGAEDIRICVSAPVGPVTLDL